MHLIQMFVNRTFIVKAVTGSLVFCIKVGYQWSSPTGGVREATDRRPSDNFRTLFDSVGTTQRLSGPLYLHHDTLKRAGAGR